MQVKVTIGKELALVKRAFFLAYNAAYAVVPPSTQAKLTEDEVFQAVWNPEDETKPLLHKPANWTPTPLGKMLTLDVCNGRQVRLQLAAHGGYVSYPDSQAIWDKQTWLNKYSTYEDLLKVAAIEIGATLTFPETAEKTKPSVKK